MLGYDICNWEPWIQKQSGKFSKTILFAVHREEEKEEVRHHRHAHEIVLLRTIGANKLSHGPEVEQNSNLFCRFQKVAALSSLAPVPRTTDVHANQQLRRRRKRYETSNEATITLCSETMIEMI